MVLLADPHDIFGNECGKTAADSVSPSAAAGRFERTGCASGAILGALAVQLRTNKLSTYEENGCSTSKHGKHISY